MAAACARCGATILAGARFCASCGAPVADSCPACGSPIQPGSRFCPSCGAPFAQGDGDADQHVDRHVDAKDERRVVSVVFADLVGSTGLAERRDPERVAAVLSAYATAMAEVVARWGGTLEKYIGDAVVAAFGVPVAHEDDARRAIDAALEMRARLEDDTNAASTADMAGLRMRIGVNTGEVLATVGTHLGQRFMAGDVVNVAARLQAAAEPGEILVAARTIESAGPGFEVEEGLDLTLKGRRAPVRAHRLLGTSAVPLERTMLLSAPMVGRDRELAAIASALEDAIEGRSPRLVLVRGPAGIGKSRLVRESVERARVERPDLTFLRGRCLAAGQESTYWALGEVVRRFFGISLDEAAPEASARLQEAVHRLLQPLGSAEADIRAAMYAAAFTAGIRIADNPLEQMRPYAVSGELAVAWPRLLSGWARHAPAVLVIEDLHWASDQLLELLELILGRSRGPVLMLCTARPEFADAHASFAVGRDEVTSIALRPLGEREGRRLIAGLLGSKDPSASIRELVLDRADGNPFFVEQLIGGLIDAGTIVSVGGTWHVVAGAPAPRLPDTVQGVLTSRIDGLPRDAKRVLQEASVVGRSFWAPALSPPLSPQIVAAGLADLETRGLVVTRPDSSVATETEFAFKHALVRDVAYGSLPLARRARAHVRIAEWLAGIAGDEAEGLLEVRASHYRAALAGEGAELAWAGDDAQRAAVRDRARETFIAAGRAARQGNAIDTAMELHQAALELADDDLQRAVILEELGDDHGWGYHGQPAVEAWEAALAIEGAAGDQEACARLYLKIARSTGIYWGGFSTRPRGVVVDRYIDEGLSYATDLRTRGWLLAIRARLGDAYSPDPDPRAGEERWSAAEAALAIAEEAGDPDLICFSSFAASGLHLRAHRPDRALALVDRELSVVDRVASSRDRIVQLMYVGIRLAELAGDLGGCLEMAQRAYAAARDLSPHDRGHSTYMLLMTLYRLGRWSEAMPYVDEHLAVIDQDEADLSCSFVLGGPAIGAILLESFGRDPTPAVERTHLNEDGPGIIDAWIAERALRNGDAAAAQRLVEALLAGRRAYTVEEGPLELPVLIDALAEQGDWDELDRVLPEVREQADRLVWLELAIDRAEARRTAALGDRVAAADQLRDVLTRYRSFGLLPEEAVTLDILADITADPHESAKARAEAHAIRDAMLGRPATAGAPS